MEHTGLHNHSYRALCTHLRGSQPLWSVDYFDLKAAGDCHSEFPVGCCKWVDLNEVVKLLMGQMVWL